MIFFWGVRVMVPHYSFMCDSQISWMQAIDTPPWPTWAEDNEFNGGLEVCHRIAWKAGDSARKTSRN